MATLNDLAGTPTEKPKAAVAANSGPVAKAPRVPVNAVDVIPYNASRDADSDKFLPYVWDKLRQDDLIRIYFPDGELTGFADFVKMMSGGANILLLVERTPEGELKRMIGFASWSPLPYGGGGAAVAGFIFFREFWDAASSVKAASAAMQQWFDVCGLKLLMGMVASENHMAQKFLQRMGWTRLGEMPGLGLYDGKPCAGTFWYLTREQFHSGKAAA